MRWNFKEENCFEKRKLESERVRRKYPDRIPVVVEKLQKSQLPSLKNSRFLVESDSTIAQFLYTIRRRLMEHDLRPTESVFFFIDETLVVLNTTMSDIDKVISFFKVYIF